MTDTASTNPLLEQLRTTPGVETVYQPRASAGMTRALHTTLAYLNAEDHDGQPVTVLDIGIDGSHPAPTTGLAVGHVLTQTATQPVVIRIVSVG